MAIERWIAGPDEDVVVERLGIALRSIGYVVDDKWDAMAGSQEVRRWEAKGPHGRLIIESETYIGVTVEGPAGVVSELRSRFVQLG